VPVDRFVTVLMSVHPSTPPINDPLVAGAYIKVRVWRFMAESRDGTADGQGQWFADEEVSIALDGDVGTNGPMQYRLPTLQAEKMYLQLIELNQTPAGIVMVPSLTALKMRETSVDDVCCGGGGGGVDSGSSDVVVLNPVWDHIDEGSVIGADTTPGLSPTVWYEIDMDTYRKLGVQFDIDPGTNGGGAGTVFIEMQGRISSTGAWAPILIDTFDTPAEQIAITGPGGITITEILADNAEKLAVYDDVRVGVYAAVGNIGQTANIFWQELY